MIPAEVFEETLRQHLAPVARYLDDPEVSEIMINGPALVFIEKRGRVHRAEADFGTEHALLAIVRNAAQFAGKLVDETRPVLEGRLPDGSRIQAIIRPAAPDGPQIAIRRFFKETLTVRRLVEFGALTDVAAEALHALVDAKMSVLIAGGTGSGKTSMLNALSSFIPEHERVVVIEEAKELQLQRDHVVHLEARAARPGSEAGVSVRDLFRATLRMRPDRVVIGEIRGGEALDIVQAMTSGHGGCMGTLHASHPRDTLTRLETMCMMSDVDLPLDAMRVQIGSGLDIIVQLARLKDGSRRLTHITEVSGFDLATGQYATRDLFARSYGGLTPCGELVSSLEPTGLLPSNTEQLRAHGVELPQAMFEAAAQLKVESDES